MSETAGSQRPALRGTRHVLSSRDPGQPLTEEQGRDALVRLALGDRAPLDLLTPMNTPDPIGVHAAQAPPPPHQADPLIQAREFGLIIEHGTHEAHLIVGEKGMVEWAPVIGLGRCVAHVHPLIAPIEPNRRSATPKWADRAGQVVRFADAVTKPSNFGTYLPTGGDVGFTIARGLPVHTVYTPYRIQGTAADRTLHAPELAPHAPLLSWDISRAAETDTEYRGLIIAFADRAPFWSSAFTINRRTATDFPVTTGFTFTTPANFG